MQVRVSTDTIYWDNMNEDKPRSLSSLSFTDKNLYVNFNNYRDVSIVVPADDETTYLEVTHNGKKYYYFVRGIDRITNKGYVKSCDLDIWATFTLPLIEKQGNTTALFNRHHRRRINRLQYRDNKTYINGGSYEFREIPEKQYLDHKNGRRWGNTVGMVTNSFRYADKPTPYSAKWKSKEVNSIMIVGYWDVLYTPDDINPYSTNVYYFGDKVQQFIYLPSSLPKSSGETKNGSVYIFNTPKGNIGDPVDALETNYAEYIVDMNQSLTKDFTFESETSDIVINNEFKWDSDKLIDEVLLDNLDIVYCGSAINWKAISKKREDGSIYFSEPAIFTLAGLPAIIFKNTRLDNSNNTLQMGEQLPWISSAYSNFVAANQASVNANWQVAKEQNKINKVRSVFGVVGGLTNMVLGGISMNPSQMGQGITQTLQGSTSVAYAWNEMKWKEKQTRAQYESANYSLNASFNQSSVDNMLYFRSGDVVPKLWYYKKYDVDVIKQMNYTIYQYGFHDPMYSTITETLENSVKKDGMYIELDKVYLEQNWVRYLSDVPKELWDLVLMQLGNGVRLWVNFLTQ